LKFSISESTTWRSVPQLRRATSKSKPVSARQERRATVGSRPILL
ncbi:unnamed protein product, partial [Strongylus vulgaris]